MAAGLNTFALPREEPPFVHPNCFLFIFVTKLYRFAIMPNPKEGQGRKIIKEKNLKGERE